MESMLPKFFANFTIKASKNGPTEVFTYEGNVPEKLMKEYQAVIGDGLAKVSIGIDFSIKDFGLGVSSMASVTLTCGQTEEHIRRASDLAAELAREFATANALQASGQLKEIEQVAGITAKR